MCLRSIRYLWSGSWLIGKINDRNFVCPPFTQSTKVKLLEHPLGKHALLSLTHAAVYSSAGQLHSLTIRNRVSFILTASFKFFSTCSTQQCKNSYYFNFLYTFCTCPSRPEALLDHQLMTNMKKAIHQPIHPRGSYFDKQIHGEL